jgi:hypothetical protein
MRKSGDIMILMHTSATDVDFDWLRAFFWTWKMVRGVRFPNAANSINVIMHHGHKRRQSKRPRDPPKKKKEFEPMEWARQSPHKVGRVRAKGGSYRAY